MEYLTTYYRRQGEGSGCSLLLQHYLCGQTPVCLACLCTEEGEGDGGMRPAVTGRLLDWCRTVCWHKAARRPVPWMGRLEAELPPLLAEIGADREGCRLSLLLGIGGEILALGGGHNLYLLSTLWGRGKAVRLPGEFRGCLEPGAGLLLAEDSFLGDLEEKRLGEALCLQEIRTADQAERRLKELAAGGGRAGGGRAGGGKADDSRADSSRAGSSRAGSGKADSGRAGSGRTSGRPGGGTAGAILVIGREESSR